MIGFYVVHTASGWIVSHSCGYFFDVEADAYRLARWLGPNYSVARMAGVRS